MNRKALITIIGLTLVVAAVLLLLTNGTITPPATFKFVASLTLTDPAYYGLQMLHSIQLAVADQNAQGG